MFTLSILELIANMPVSVHIAQAKLANIILLKEMRTAPAHIQSSLLVQDAIATAMELIPLE